MKDLFGLSDSSSAEQQQQDDGTEGGDPISNHQKNKKESFVLLKKQDATSCFTDKYSSELNLEGTTDKCHVTHVGTFYPKYLKKTLMMQQQNKNKKNKNTNSADEDEPEIISIEKDFHKDVSVSKYSPLTLNETWKVTYTDTTYKTTIRLPLPEVLSKAGYDCQLLHKKCWKCAVVTSGDRQQQQQQFVEITNGVSIREYYPDQDTNRCLDCARAAELSNEGGEVPFKCTLQCTRGKSSSDKNKEQKMESADL